MGKSALVVVDVQNYFINKHTKGLPEKIQKFIVKNRDDFDFVLFTKFVNDKKSNYFKLWGWKDCFSSPDIDIHPALIEFTKNSENS